MEHIEDCISFLVSKAAQQINACTKRQLQPYGITPVQYAILKVLWEQDGQSGAALSERLQLDSATLTGVLDRLGAAQLIERQPDPNDRRINRIQLTAAGQALQAPLDAAIDAVNAEVLAQLSASEASQFRTLLARIGNVEPRL